MHSSAILVCLMPLVIQGFLFGTKKTEAPVVKTTTLSVLPALVSTTTSTRTTPFTVHSGTTVVSSPITERCAAVTYGGSPDNRYCGSFSGKRRNGLGIRIYGDGSAYLGDYRLDGVTGIGYWLEKNSTGGRYLGDIVSKLKEGNGYFLWANGDSYMGSWHANKMNGEGVFLSKNTKQVYIGSFLNGVKSGRGTIISNDGTVVFKGLFANDQPVKI